MIDTTLDSAAWEELGLIDKGAIAALEDKWVLIAAPNEEGKKEIIGGGYSTEGRFVARWTIIPSKWPSEGREIMVVSEGLHNTTKRTLVYLIGLTMEMVHQVEMLQGIVTNAVRYAHAEVNSPNLIGAEE